MVKRIFIITGFIVLILISALELFGSDKTRTDIINAVRARAVDIDSDRFPDTLLHDWINEESEDIATVGQAIENDTTIELTTDAYSYSLPSDFYILRAAILNPDPAEETGGDNRPVRLNYKPLEDYGKRAQSETGRPRECYISNKKGEPKFLLERLSATGDDLVTVYYFAHAEAMTHDTSVIRLPEQYFKLLVGRIVLKCYNRIKLAEGPTRESLDQDIANLESKLLGRTAHEP